MNQRQKVFLEQILNEVEKIPPLPAIAMQALQMMNDPEFSIKKLGKTLETDQALASALLRGANSSYYGLINPVITVQQAITYLGETTVRSLVLTASLRTHMDRPIKGYYLTRGDLWRHAVALAMVSRIVAKKFGYRTAEEAYTAGLLCDIGKLALEIALRSIPQDKMEWENISFDQVEKEIFGINHPQIGAQISKRWNFPDSLQEAILFHHQPSLGDAQSLIPSIIHIADIIVSMMGIGLGRDGLHYNIDPFALKRLGIPEDGIQELFEEALWVSTSIEEMVNI
jgi:HD-like signal output (HDOD) protein